jgi:hypothetical protein
MSHCTHDCNQGRHCTCTEGWESHIEGVSDLLVVAGGILVLIICGPLIVWWLK